MRDRAAPRGHFARLRMCVDSPAALSAARIMRNMQCAIRGLLGAVVLLTCAGSALSNETLPDPQTASSDSAIDSRLQWSLADQASYGVLDAAEQVTSVQIDNDVFARLHRDRDYTGGATVTFGTPSANPIVAPVDVIRRRLNEWLPLSVPDNGHGIRSTQVGLIVMTPDHLTIRAAQPNDRPYASLLYLATSQINIADDGARASYSSFSVGGLGLHLTESIQDAIHGLVEAHKPRGWSHQISDGGEPTARFVRAEQWLLGAGEAHAGGAESKVTLSGSVGYLTEASAALSMRVGRIRSPWWNSNPELADYTAAPIAPLKTAPLEARELYFFFGGRVKARAYNALLQGQFRSSDVTVASDDIARIQGETWLGLAASLARWRLCYTVHAASKEVDHGPAARTLIWGGINFERAL